MTTKQQHTTFHEFTTHEISKVKESSSTPTQNQAPTSSSPIFTLEMFALLFFLLLNTPYQNWEFLQIFWPLSGLLLRKIIVLSLLKLPLRLTKFDHNNRPICGQNVHSQCCCCCRCCFKAHQTCLLSLPMLFSSPESTCMRSTSSYQLMDENSFKVHNVLRQLIKKVCQLQFTICSFFVIFFESVWQMKFPLKV